MVTNNGLGVLVFLVILLLVHCVDPLGVAPATTEDAVDVDDIDIQNLINDSLLRQNGTDEDQGLFETTPHEPAPIRPIVLWHGMGDSCCFPFSLGALKNNLEKSLPGVYVLSLKIGKSVINDVENGYFLHPDKQIKMACDIVSSDPNLQNTYINLIGFSQGAQFMRGLIQRCSGLKVGNFISIGGQHQGVYGLPNCASLSHASCNYLRRLLNHAAYIRWVQRSLVQATYWHDPLHVKEYQKGSTFIADINNEIKFNPNYRDRLLRLDNFVMVKFEKDSMVEPVETEWFGFYRDGQSQEIQSLQESDIYKSFEDRLGLRKLDQRGQLHFLSLPTNHLQFDWDWFEENIVQYFLKP